VRNAGHGLTPAVFRKITAGERQFQLASGELRGTVALEEFGHGDVVDRVRMRSRRKGADWVVTGLKPTVLDGNTDTLWLIDARRLTVIRTEEVTRAASPLQRLGEWLGLVPAVALAKGGEGAVLSLHMSPDGRTLYATGRRGEITADGTVAMHFLPLQAIDVAHGTILAETPAADGSTC